MNLLGNTTVPQFSAPLVTQETQRYLQVVNLIPFQNGSSMNHSSIERALASLSSRNGIVSTNLAVGLGLFSYKTMSIQNIFS